MISPNLSASLAMRDSTSIASLGIPAGPTSPYHKLSSYPGIPAHIRHDAGACQGRRRKGLQLAILDMRHDYKHGCKQEIDAPRNQVHDVPDNLYNFGGTGQARAQAR
jgi:hypothetical protein